MAIVRQAVHAQGLPDSGTTISVHLTNRQRLSDAPKHFCNPVNAVELFTSKAAGCEPFAVALNWQAALTPRRQCLFPPAHWLG
jgi:hypothetical protein